MLRESNWEVIHQALHCSKLLWVTLIFIYFFDRCKIQRITSIKGDSHSRRSQISLMLWTSMFKRTNCQVNSILTTDSLTWFAVEREQVVNYLSNCLFCLVALWHDAEIPVRIADHLFPAGVICLKLWLCLSLWSEPPWCPSGPPATPSCTSPLHLWSASSNAHPRPVRRGSYCTYPRFALWNLLQTSRK